MKLFHIRYILLIVFLAFGQLGAWGQLSTLRNTNTKIADLLATQPAENPDRLSQSMQQLEQFTASEFSTLLQSLQEVGNPANTPILYAINSYSFYVSTGADARTRETFNSGVLDAIQHIQEPVHGRFLMRLLARTASDDHLPTIVPYLSEADYVQPASEVLARLSSDAAGQALLQALQTTQGPQAIPLIDALGQMAYLPAESMLIERSQADHPDIQRRAYAALAHIGGPSSGSVLQQAAEKVSYQYEPSGATAALLEYITRQTMQGAGDQTSMIAQQIFQTKDLPYPVKTRTLQLLVEMEGPKQLDNLIRAARDTDVAYSQTALQLLLPYSQEQVTSRLVEQWDRMPPAIQINILDYLGASQQTSVIPQVKTLLENSDSWVSAAAARALHALEGDASIPFLLPYIGGHSERSKAIEQILLSSGSPDLGEHLLNALSQATDTSQQENLLRVLGQRHMKEAGATVIKLAKESPSASIREVAQSILPQVVGVEFLPELLELMASVGTQKAIIQAVQQSKEAEQHIPLILEHHHQAPTSLKAGFFPIFAGIASPEMLDITVDAAFNQADPTMQATAMLNLAEWSTSASISPLISWVRSTKVVDTEEMAALRVQVIEGLIQQITAASYPGAQKTLLLRDLFDEVKNPAQQRLILSALESTQTFQAMMFAGKYLDDEHLRSRAAYTVMGIALNNPEFSGPLVVNMLEKVSSILSGSESSYLREAIARHIASLPNESGWTSLFNGQDLQGWKGLVANPIRRAAMSDKELAEAQIEADTVMRGGWYVEDGELHFNGKGDNIATIRDYGDIEMYLDWKLAADGQDGDAGVYLRGTPQVQIWDTSRVDVGAQVGSGGLYNNQVNPSVPLVVADNALGEWNSFYIKMVDDRVTVYLNGQLVTDHVPLENYWDRQQAIFPSGQIELQAHGTHVSYRDIYIRELPRNQIFQLSQEEKDEGFEVLFDGTSLEHWVGNTADYVISDENTLAVYPKEGSGGNLYTRETYSDFVFRFSFRLTPGANNGVGIRTPMEGDAAYVGMEIQVLDDGADIYKNLHDYQYHGSVYGIIAAKRGHLKPVGEWNEEEIYVQGNYIRVTLNGAVIVEGDLGEATKNGTLDGLEHPGVKNKEGHIGFLGHGSEVEFKDIRIKPLEDASIVDQ